MVKRKTEKTETIEELVEEIKSAESEVKGDAANKNGDELVDTVDDKRKELIRLSEDGEVTHKVPYLQKAAEKIILKLHKQMEEKRMEKANMLLTDLLISKFAGLLGGLEAIESEKELNAELQIDKLLKHDVESIVKKITPYVPFLGLVSGGATTVKHIADKYYNPKDGSIVQAEKINDAGSNLCQK